MRILVVEDEPLLAMALEDNLAQLGHEVAGSAATVSQALSMLDEEQIDCALLDFSLSDDTTSLAVAQRLVSAGKPFYFLTGHMCLEENVPLNARLLTKPISLGQLQTALNEMTPVHC